jgi:hypothetical protein
MEKPEICQRIEETQPTDRVRGTVVNVTDSIFVIKFDNGDYVAYQVDDSGGFHDCSDKPVPSHAADLIHRLRVKHGTTPPEDIMRVGVLDIEDNSGVPHPRRHNRDAGKVEPKSGGALTSEDQPPSIEA